MENVPIASCVADSMTNQIPTCAAEIDHLRLAAPLAGLTIAEAVLPEDGNVLASGLRPHDLDWGIAGRPPVFFLQGELLTGRR